MRSETVEVKVDVLARDALSVSLLFGFAALILGEAGWKRVGGMSLGNRLGWKDGNPAGILSEADRTLLGWVLCLCRWEVLRLELYLNG